MPFSLYVAGKKYDKAQPIFLCFFMFFSKDSPGESTFLGAIGHTIMIMSLCN